MNTGTSFMALVMAAFAGCLATVHLWGGAVFFTLLTLLFIGDGIAAAIKECAK